MRIICISDNHEQNLMTKWTWPEGHILVHAGDLTAMGGESKVLKMAKQLSRLRLTMGYSRVLYVPGNHDKSFANERTTATNIMNAYGIDTLIDQYVVIDGLTFYGCPWIQLQPEDTLKLHEDALAFSRLDCREHFDKIPVNTDVLITHQPPGGILDKTDNGESIGSSQLANRLRYLKTITYIFGHNHSGHGICEILDRRFINAALCDEKYRPVYEPIIIDL